MKRLVKWILTRIAVVAIISLTAGQFAAAADVRMTIYDDGKSCPGNCDAHVVFHPSMNGTEFAHDPATHVKPYKDCRTGTECEICLRSAGKECLKVMYRGAGPREGTFDFTPTFYENRCSQTDGLPSLEKKCAALEKEAQPLLDKVNCIRTPDHPSCRELMADAHRKQDADLLLHDQCVAEKSVKFNHGRPVGQQRTKDCSYELKGTGRNTHGKTWRKLLPGACRVGTFVGRDGLDCCNGNPSTDGPLNVECRAFYPKG